MTPRKGDVGFCTKRGNFLAKAIRWFTRSKWSHTYVIYQTEPEILVLEAGVFQVQLVPFSKYESKKYVNAVMRPVNFMPDAIEKGLAKVKEKIEAHYGWLQLIGFIPVVLFKRLLGMKISNPAKGGIICSELVLQYLRGLDPGCHWDKMDRNATSPEDLFEELAIDSGFTLIEE